MPTEFRVLVNTIIDPGELKVEIERLIQKKEKGAELDYGPQIPVISDYIDKEMERLEKAQFGDVTNKWSTDELNDLFRDASGEVWS